VALRARTLRRGDAGFRLPDNSVSFADGTYPPGGQLSFPVSEVGLISLAFVGAGQMRSMKKTRRRLLGCRMNMGERSEGSVAAEQSHCAAAA
jgi:hypothetical protein